MRILSVRILIDLRPPVPNPRVRAVSLLGFPKISMQRSVRFGQLRSEIFCIVRENLIFLRQGVQVWENIGKFSEAESIFLGDPTELLGSGITIW